MGLWDIFKNKAHQAMKNDYYKESSKSDDYIATPDQLDAIGNELDAVYKDIFSISGGANANRKITDWCFAIVVLQLSCCNCRIAIVVLQLLRCNYLYQLVVWQLLCCNCCFAIVALQFVFSIDVVQLVVRRPKKS